MGHAVYIDAPIGRLCVVAPPGYQLQEADWHDGGVTAQVTVDAATDNCATCGRSTRRRGRTDVGIRDAPSGGVQARLMVARQRVECETCERRSREALPGVSEGHRFTDRCAGWMASQFRFRSNLAIASVVGLDEKSVRLFAGEQGIVTGRARARIEASLQCASCLRLTSETPTAAVRYDHASPRGDPDLIPLCADCNADAGSRWIKRL